MSDFTDTTVVETDVLADEGSASEHLATASVAMNDTRTERQFGWWLALIAGAGLFLRVFVVIHSQNHWVGGDGLYYGLQANLFAHGHPFVDPFNPALPTALHPPAWPLLLGFVAFLGGHSWLSLQLVACTIGTATVVVIGLAGRRIAGARVGLIGAAIGAVYAGLWIYERDLLSETLLLLGIAVTLVLAYRFLDDPSPWLAAGLGVMTGLMALTRSEQILVWAILVVPLILSAHNVARRRRVGWLAIATASLVIVLAPWTIYNLPRFQHVVLLSNNSGSAIAQGNCEPVYYGPLTGSYEFGCVAFVKSTDESVANPIDFRKGTTYAEHHLSRLPVVLFAREGRSLGFWYPFQQISLDSGWQVTPVWVNQMGLFTYWLLLVPAVAGVVVMRRRRRALYPLLAFVATVVVATATTYGETRLRATAEVPLVLLAAVGIDAGFRCMHRRGGAEVETVAGATPRAQPEVLTTSPSGHGARLDRMTAVTPGFLSRIALSAVAVVASLSLCAAGVTAIVGAVTLNSSLFEVRVVAPSNGATVSNEQTLVATTTNYNFIKTVTFQIRNRRLTTTNVEPATKTRYGWVATWDTSTVPDGTYRVQCVVSFADSLLSPVTSQAIPVVVTHG